MKRVVLKYGGTSVETIDKIKKIALYIKELKKNVDEIVVVVSAMGKKTDELIKEAEEVSNGKIAKRELDVLLTIGEQESMALLSLALNSIGCESISYLGYQIDLKTTGEHLEGEIFSLNTNKIEMALEKGKVVIIAGFQGINNLGDLITLGRGGSDTTAVALAANLRCPCKIYTDVDGVYTKDPRKFKEAKKYDKISYFEMEKLALEGAEVLELKSVRIGKKYNVDLYIGKSLTEETGTYIYNF